MQQSLNYPQSEPIPIGSLHFSLQFSWCTFPLEMEFSSNFMHKRSVNILNLKPYFLLPETMKNSSPAPVRDASVKVETCIFHITIKVIFQHTGDTGDFITIHDHFFDALDGELIIHTIITRLIKCLTSLSM